MSVESFVQDPDFGDLYVCNGIDPVLRWDGVASSFENAGMVEPTGTLTLAGSGTGQIVGSYWAYLRFVDTQGNFSNLSPISLEFTAHGNTGTITNVTATTPIVVTSAAHGLVTTNFVKIAGVGGLSTANNTWQITVIDANSFSLDLSVSDGITAYTGGGTWESGISTITYTNVQTPTEAKVVRRQILRNTDGEAITFYVDVDTTDLTATSFTSTLIDSLLGAGIAAPLLDANGLPLANANDPPPNYFKCNAQQLDRMFMAGLVEYNIGSCSVTFGSATVIGAGTHWKTTLAGRFLYIDGASKTYEISSVNETLQTLTLTNPYTDTTDLFAFYAIKMPPAYRRLLAFAQGGTPQSWPAFNALAIQETGDEITGLFQMGPFLYITERSHTHHFIFSTSPLIDGGRFMSAYRGAVNQRCVIQVDSVAYMLDELGVHRFKGNKEVDPVSLPIQTIFRDDQDNYYQINWRWKEYFHGVLDRQRETVRWFVSLDGNRYPKHALCFQYRLNRWWIEEYPYPIGGACIGYLGGSTGVPQVYYGGFAAKILAAWIDTTDGVAGAEGTTQSLATSAGSFSVTDSAASFPTVGTVNSQVAIIAGTGRGQSRRIVSVSGTTLAIDSPWSVIPDTTSVYQIGGIPWVYKSSWMRLSDDETMADRRFEMLFEPTKSATVADLQFFSDFTGDADVQSVTVNTADGAGVSSIAGDTVLALDLTKKNGLIQQRLPGHREYFSQGKRWVQYQLDGMSNEDQVRLYQMLYEGVKGGSG